MWKDTCLILTTDHGFLLGEHDWWSKNRMPVFDEISRIPLMVYHPEFKDQSGTRRKSLTQTIDIMPTIMELHNHSIPEDVSGNSIMPLFAKDTPIRSSAIFGYFGAACNITDGTHVYHRYPEKLNADGLYEYTLMPTRMTTRFPISDLVGATLTDPFSFTKGAPLMKLKPRTNEKGDPVECQGMDFEDTKTQLYNLEDDPKQENPINDPEIEAKLISEMIHHMNEADAPKEMYSRFNLELEN
jgi:arylsulfatase A-like enzyme